MNWSHSPLYPRTAKRLWILPTHGLFFVSNFMMFPLRILVAIFLAICAASCRDAAIEQPRNIYCGVEDPVAQLEWLHNDVAQYEHSSTHMDAFLYTALYKDERVFYIDICCPACTIAPPEVKNCKGEVLGRLGDGIDPGELAGAQIIWRTVNGVCNR
jgi:hypothetical protein